MAVLRLALLVAAISLVPGMAPGAESTCFGTVANGRLEGGVALRSAGANFSSYSASAQLLGRTYVHAKVAEVVAAAYRAARAQGIGVALVIFDRAYLFRLLATPRGAHLKQNLRFMKGKPWVRHDEHYHIDFAVPCEPLAGGRPLAR